MFDNAISRYRICFYDADGFASVFLTGAPTPRMLEAHSPELAEADHNLNVVIRFNPR